MRHFLMAIPALVMALPAAAQEAFTVFFPFDSSRIDAAGVQAIDSAVQAFNTEGSASVSIVGHTDTVGSREYNMALSQRRAEAVAAALMDRGVPSDAMTLAWRGFDEPAVDTGPNVREQRNRRAEIVLGGAVATPEAQPIVQALPRLFIGVGPYFAYNAENPDNDSFLAGGNAVVSYFVTGEVELEGEAGLFYEFDTDDEDLGTRLMVGANYHFGDFFGMQPFGAGPYVGANVGWIGMDGTGTGGFAGGPELGAQFGPVDLKLHYDFVEDRDWDDGVYGVSLIYNFAVPGF